MNKIINPNTLVNNHILLENKNKITYLLVVVVNN